MKFKRNEDIEAYENSLYQTFYSDGPSVEKYLPSLPRAINLYNTFFRKLYEECGATLHETTLIKRFTYFIYDLTKKPHYIYVKHHSEKSVFYIEGALWDISDIIMARTGQPMLWQEYEIEVADALHSSQFDTEITLAHELVHIVERNLRTK